jgi:hypothetical protein
MAGPTPNNRGPHSEESVNPTRRTGRPDGFGKAPGQETSGPKNEESENPTVRKRPHKGESGNTQTEIVNSGPQVSDLESPQDLERDANIIEE